MNHKTPASCPAADQCVERLHPVSYDEATMAARSYWLDLFTGTTWEEFLAAGADVTGFREKRWSTVQKIQPGDYLLCYLTGISRFVGLLEATSPAFRDSAPIWKDEEFPCRVRV